MVTGEGGNIPMTDYCSFHAHHIGKSHMTSGLPCQDCSFSWNEEALTVAIVADGHGSSAFVRSDKGSRFAVFAATKAITEFTESLREKGIDLSATILDVEQAAEEIAAYLKKKSEGGSR